MHFATLLILATTLVLHSGDRISAEGPITQQDGVVIFRSGGALYSMPLSEIDEAATNAANASAEISPKPAPKPLKVSPAERMRLLKELEQNHYGKPATEQRMDTPPYIPQDAPGQNADEWRWRREARSYEEGVRQAKESLDLLLDRVDRLRAEIRGFVALGFKPQNFTYQTTQLAYAEEQIPSAQLYVERAQRVYDQFREDARRQGVLPGWLR
ncbi:MAG TPA: hypothetical protein VGS96_07295 [Thermoanaerobaculia bacterium]|jgi:hypothetical protein|nr:hypothetical protein [Thermoanaerobaculia bacterium]